MNDRKWSWAVALLARHGDQARVLAGGTDLVAGRHATDAPRGVLDIKGLTVCVPKICATWADVLQMAVGSVPRPVPE